VSAGPIDVFGIILVAPTGVTLVLAIGSVWC